MSCTWHILMDYVADQRQCATLHNLDWFSQSEEIEVV